jgi:Asp-tRNA(Asn)/Glu-tRNA(Gln) amidotransferase A subunit family amidase
MAFGALGNDTGGSIRIPSAVCGTVGLKPAAGDLPCDGIVPLSTTLEHVGPMARSVEETALLYVALRGDGRTTDLTPPTPVRLGIPRAYFYDLLDDGVREALGLAERRLREAGHEVVDDTIDHADWTAPVYLHLVLPEASWYHAPLLERHASSYSPGVRLRLEMGRSILAEDYVRALHLRDALRARVERALDNCTALLLPALAIPAPRLGAATVRVGTSDEPVRGVMLRLTQLFNITGHPAIALPAPPVGDGWPRSIQLVGRHDATSQLLALARLVEAQISGGPGSVGGGTG